MTSYPEAMGWGFWDLIKTVSWDSTLEEGSWFSGARRGQTSSLLRGTARGGVRWKSQHRKKLCVSLSLLMFCMHIMSMLWSIADAVSSVSCPILFKVLTLNIKGFTRELEILKIGVRVETIQTTTILRSSWILRRVLEAYGILQSFRLQGKTIIKRLREKLARSKMIWQQRPSNIQRWKKKLKKEYLQKLINGRNFLDVLPERYSGPLLKWTRKELTDEPKDKEIKNNA